MKFISKLTLQGEVQISYIDSKLSADPSLTPLVICPGLSETAEEYVEFMEYLLPRRAVVISFRGRGQSDTPVHGYNLKDHVDDIKNVVEAAQLNNFHLMGFSRGVAYALGYGRDHLDRLQSFILLDYPLEHRSMVEDWIPEYIDQYLIPTNRIQQIRKEAVIGIQRDSTYESLSYSHHKPVLLIHGELEESLIQESDILQYKTSFSQLTIKTLHNSGHNIRNTEQHELNEAIKMFMLSL